MHSNELGSMSMLSSNPDNKPTLLGDRSGKSPFSSDISISCPESKTPSYSSTIPNTGRPRKASIVLDEAYNRDRLNGCHETGSELSGCVFDGPGPMPVTADTALGLRLTKCALHGEMCDGEAVANLHLTEDARWGRGFKDCYPVVEGGGRIMIDWYKIMSEERMQMQMGL